MYRAIKNSNFKLDPYLNTKFVFDSLERLFKEFELPIEHECVKCIKNVYVELVKSYPQATL